jgi:hypothetical protein
MFVPVAGPWLSLATWYNSRPHTAAIAFLVTDGLVQAGGVAMAIAGAFVRHPVLVFDYLGRGQHSPEHLTVSVAPSANGASILGTF